MENWNSARKKKVGNGYVYKNVCPPFPSIYVPNLMSLISNPSMETRDICSAQILCCLSFSWANEPDLIQSTCFGLLPMFFLDQIFAF